MLVIRSQNGVTKQRFPFLNHAVTGQADKNTLDKTTSVVLIEHTTTTLVVYIRTKLSMNRESLPRLTPTELEIMQVIWELGEATINEVTERINLERSTPLRRTTLQVQMTRLETKGWLAHRENGRTFLYSSPHDRDETLAEMATDMKDRAFGGSCTELVKCLIDQQKISEQELQSLRKLIQEID